MEIRNIRTAAGFAAYPTRTSAEDTAASHSSTDRVDLSRQWVEQMEDQRKQLLSLLSRPAGQDKENKSDGILDMLDGVNAEKEELDALSQQLKTRMKCLEIARRIMQGKKVPPQDERYLMENDPKGYQLAMALRKPPKKDEKECKSVLDSEDEKSGETSDSGESAPVETSSGDGEPAVSTDNETAE